MYKWNRLILPTNLTLVINDNGSLVETNTEIFTDFDDNSYTESKSFN